MSRSLGRLGIAALASCALLAPSATLAFDKQAHRSGQRALKQNKSLGGPRTKGESRWQPGAYAVNPDLGNVTGGPARQLLRTPAKPSRWAHQYDLKSGRANLYDHKFETPKKRRNR